MNKAFLHKQNDRVCVDLNKNNYRRLFLSSHLYIGVEIGTTMTIRRMKMKITPATRVDTGWVNGTIRNGGHRQTDLPFIFKSAMKWTTWYRSCDGVR